MRDAMSNVCEGLTQRFACRNAKEHPSEAQFPERRPNVPVSESRGDFEEVLGEQHHQRRVLTVPDIRESSEFVSVTGLSDFFSEYSLFILIRFCKLPTNPNNAASFIPTVGHGPVG